MNEKVFIPAQPHIVPVAQTPSPMHPVPKAADAQSQTPPSATKRVSSRMMAGAPSKTPPPHVNPVKAVVSSPVKREYAWQRRRALGKKI